MKRTTKLLTAILSVMLITTVGCKKISNNSANTDVVSIPTGAINGKFTINENGDQIYFSKGNLQYQASTDTWRFAEHQWGFVGSTEVTSGSPCGNVEGSSNHLMSNVYYGWIDLFGFECETGHNPTWQTYYGYNYCKFNEYGSYSISNGGDSSNIWRILTYEEWWWLLFDRNTNSGSLFAKATVGGVNGLIILPDNWNNTIYSLANINEYQGSFMSNIISTSVWIDTFETNGAVFLPAAGSMFIHELYEPTSNVHYAQMQLRVGFYGSYWNYKESPINDGELHALSYNDTSIGISLGGDAPSNYHYGLSVRLVCSAE